MNWLLGGSWNAMRVLRVGLGLTAGLAGIVYRDPLVATLGGITLLQGVFNLSCCGVASCAVPPNRQHMATEENEYGTIKK